MKRIEIIANHSVEADIIEAVEKVCQNKAYYTKIPVVYGKGNSNPKMGDNIWPEENFMLIIYAEEKISFQIRNAVEDIKLKFPDEGIKLFDIG